jgi:hypothetical protein
MKNWKALLEKALAKEYKGTTIKWNGDNPTLVIPDALENKASKIVEYATDLWCAWGGEVEFCVEQAGHTIG